MSSAEVQVSLPDHIESPRAKLVYLYLATTGETSVTELQQTLGMSKLALLPILDALTAKEVIARTEKGYARC